VRLDIPAKIEADWSERLQKLKVRDLEKSENRYAYALDTQRGRQIIAIRGTANLANALLDLESWKDLSPVLGIKLHHGFEKAASIVFEDARQFLDFKLPVIVCGHSLGAAEAIILGMLLSKAGYRVEKILASGPPKVTDAKGVAAYANLPVVLVTSAFDPVPFLPPALFCPSQPFVQWGPLLMLLDGSYATVASPRFYDEISPAFKEAKQYSEHFDVVDHRVWTYYDRALEKMKGIEFVPFDEWPMKALPRK
jgi:pimeloyl-ACP methyl ester carboxylesterase